MRGTPAEYKNKIASLFPLDHHRDTDHHSNVPICSYGRKWKRENWSRVWDGRTGESI